MKNSQKKKLNRERGHRIQPAALVIFYGVMVATGAICGVVGVVGDRAQASPIPASDGTGTVVNQTGNTYDITGGQLSGDGGNLFHSFQELGLDTEQTANFLSSPEINNILGRVTGGRASIINGLIQVTGGNSNLFLINPAGILFGPNASLNVTGDFTATSATGIGFDSGWFNAFGSNNYSALIGEPSTFDFSLSQPGAILNEGNLTLNPEQNLTLLGGTVVNLGTLTSPGGNITIAAVPGENLVRINQENHLLSLEVPTCNTANCNASANQPPQNFTPAKLPSLLTGGQVTHASDLTLNDDGTISLTGSNLRLPANTGVAVASGNIDVSDTSTNGDATGGTVAVLGEKVALVDANISANGANDAGRVLVGGEYQGQGEVPNASNTFVSKDTLISADAIEHGDGGEVIIWADETTNFHGEITAKGGTDTACRVRTCDGGFVEVSGKRNLIFRGEVDTTAPQGQTGTLLLDPQNITIMDGDGGANDAEVLDGLLEELLPGETFTISQTALEGIAADTNITLQATNDITIEDLTDNTLSLPTTGGLVGTDGLVTFSSAGGNFSMDPGDTIETQGADIWINVPGTITVGNINTNGGTINLSGQTDVTVGSLTTNGGYVEITAGLYNNYSVTLNQIDTNGGDVTAQSPGGTIIVNGDINAGIGTIALQGLNGDPPAQEIEFGNSVTLTANDIILDAEIISATQPGLDFVIEQAAVDGTIEIGNIPECDGSLCLDNQAEFNRLQNAGFNSITIGRADGTGTVTIGGINPPPPPLGTTTTIQGGTIDITAPLIAQDNNLTLTADVINLNAAISGTGIFTLQPTTVDQGISIGNNDSDGILGLNATDLNNIQNGFSSIIIGRADGSGPVTVDAPLLDNNTAFTFQDPLTIQSPSGSITTNFGIIGTDNASVTLDSPTNTLNANITTNNQNITIIGNTTLGNNVTLNTVFDTIGDPGNIDLQGTVNGAQDLTLNALNVSTGNISIGDAVGGTTPLASLTATGNTTINGNVTTTGTQTYNNNLSFNNPDPQITAGELNLNGTVSGTGNLVVQPETTTSAIELGGNNQSAGLNLTEAELQLINGFGSVTIGRNDGTGTINIAGVVDLSAENFDLTILGGPLTFNNGINLRESGTLTLNTGSITSLALTDRDIAINNGTLVLDVSGDVGEQQSPLVTEVSQLDIENVSGNLFVENFQNLDLVTANITGNLAITNNGNITDSGTINVGGSSSFTTTANDATITLDQLSALLPVSLNTTGSNADATVTNATGVNLATSNIGGDLNITATTGNITDSGIVTVGGNSNFTTSETDAVITLDQSSVTGSISVNTTGPGGDATITNNQAIDLATSNVGGSLNVTATNGNITDSGIVTVGGNSNFTTNETDADIALEDLIGTGSISVNTTGLGGDATITNNQAIDLATSNVGGDLNVTATTGNITDSGIVTVGGNSNFSTNETDAEIILNQLAVSESISVNTTGTTGNATVSNSTTVNLADSNIGGSLNATATNGNIDNSGVINAVSDITLTGDSIALNNDVTSGGSLNATATNGAIDNSGVINAVSDITLTGDSIALNNDVTSGGSLNATANNGSIDNSGVINAVTDITLNGDSIALNNDVKSGGNITLQPLNPSTTIDIGGETGIFNLSAAELANLSDGFSSITIGRSDGTGTVTVGSLSFSDPLTIQSGTGQLTVNGTITGTDNASVNLNSNNINLNSGITTNNQNITITGNTFLGSDITLSSGTAGGNIAFTGNVDGNQNLTLNAGTGRVSFTDAIGNSTALNGLIVNSAINSGLRANANIIQLNNDITSAGADVVLNANNQLTTNNITTNGGDIGLTNNNGDVTAGNLDSSNPNTVGGAITVNSPTGVVITGNLTSTGTTGGDITVMAQTSITTGDIDSSGTVGNGGHVFLDPDDFIDVGFINAQGGTSGSGGNVDIITRGVFRANNTFTDQNGEIASISTAGGAGSGNVSLSHGGGNLDIDMPFVVGDATNNGTAGVITTGADNTIPLGSSFPGPVEQGNIQVITAEPPIPEDPNPVVPVPLDETPVSLQLDPEPETSVTEEPVTEEAVLNTEVAPEVAPEVAEPEAQVSSEIAATSEEVIPVAIEEIPVEIAIEPVEEEPISVDIPEPIIVEELEETLLLEPEEIRAITTNLESTEEEEEEEEIKNLFSPETVSTIDPGVAEIENSFTQAFTDYNGIERDTRKIRLPEAQNIIRRIESSTGIKPVLLYVRFAPTSMSGISDNDPLELILVTSDGSPLRKVLSATRAEVLATADDLITYITAPRYRRRTTYLEPAQQFYQWLIAPIKEELDSQGIDNIAFIMDQGLRGLPVAALHDGSEFLVSKYSVGMMPTLSLTDTRYRNIQNASVLAMGASEFDELNPLPAVPTELETITEEIRGGSSFLNEAFTLKNIQSEYAEQQYPIVHMATHGEFKSGDISNSYIQLWDKKLRLNDIRELGFHNPTVELLVLSACRTAVGSPEAELGFAGLALQAGVKSAIASLWYVSDEGTFGLMTEFYKQLSTAPIKAEAMRQAQIEMINGNVMIEEGQMLVSSGSYALPESLQEIQNQTLTHPYYWSAFTLIGSPW